MRNINKIFITVLFFVSAIIITSTDIHAQTRVLNNNKLRFGTGAENSVNTLGNLQQPNYYNAVAAAWRKLTYSNYPLDNAFAFGGIKTNEWNLNGSIVVNPAISGQVIDASGYVITSGNNGYGTIVSTGNIILNGQMLEVKNTYFLPQDYAYIKVTTRLRNVSSGLMENVRTWTGTRDDWVGLTDAPRKQKGNLVDGAFAQNTLTTQRALALKLSTGAEGVVFYTPSNKANIIVHPNYGDFLSRIVNTNPVSSSLDITSDGSYGMYVRMNDLQAGASDEFSWYYLAGELSELNAIIAEVASVSGAVNNIAYTTADFKATTSVNSTGYWMVVPRNSANPTAAQIKLGTNYAPVTVTASGTGTMLANVEKVFNMTTLTAGTDYDLHFVSQDAALTFSAILKVPFTTLAYVAPQIVCPTNSTVNNIAGQCGATVNFIATETTAIPASTITYSVASGSLFPVGTTVVTATATNIMGSSVCTFNVTVVDNEVPTIEVLPNINVFATSGSGAMVNYTTPVGVDNCTGATTALIAGLASGSTFPIGVTTVTYKVTDAAGNTAQSSFDVTVTALAPAIECPTNVIMNNAAGLCGANVNFVATETTAIPASTITYSIAPESFFSIGTTTVTATATNAIGVSTCEFSVTVIDNEVPTIEILSNINVFATSAAGAVVNYATPIGVDNCLGATTELISGLASGSTFPIGVTTLTYQVTDAAGNTAQSVFDVTVTGLAPVIECPTNISVNNAAGDCGASVNFIATETTAIPASTITYSIASGSYFPVGTTTVTATATNAIGVSTCIYTVTVLDVTNPAIMCPANVFVNAGQPTSPAETGTATATDNCSGVQVTSSDASTQTASGNGNTNYTITRTWTATDVSGNSESCNQDINICDISVSLGSNKYALYGALGYAGCAVLTPVITGGLAPFTYSWSSDDSAINGLSSSSVTPCNTFDGTRTYTVVVTSANGCTATSTVSVTYININCSSNSNTVKVKVCHIPQGNSTNCKTICVSINAYQTLLNNGSYLGECLPLCALPTQSRSEVNISDYVIENKPFEVTFWPNPANNVFNITVDSESDELIQMMVLNINGQIIDKVSDVKAGSTITIGNDWKPGFYLLETTQGNQKKLIKMIKTQ